MIAKLERTQSNAQQNKDKHRTPTTNGKQIKLIEDISNKAHVSLLVSKVILMLISMESDQSLEETHYNVHSGALTCDAQWVLTFADIKLI